MCVCECVCGRVCVCVNERTRQDSLYEYLGFAFGRVFLSGRTRKGGGNVDSDREMKRANGSYIPRKRVLCTVVVEEKLPLILFCLQRYSYNVPPRSERHLEASALANY